MWKRSFASKCGNPDRKIKIYCNYVACAADELLLLKSICESMQDFVFWISYMYSNLIGFSGHLFERNVLNLPTMLLVKITRLVEPIKIEYI